MTVDGLVLNLGLKSVRAIAFDRGGHKLASASRPVQTMLRDTWMEQDPDEWWAKSVEVLREIAEDLGGRPSAFITVTASAACLVPVDAEGRALRRAIMVSDRRAVPQAERVAAAPAFERHRSRNPAFSGDPYYLLPKALWISEEEPEVFARTRWMLTPADFLVFRLCGEAVTDPLNAEKFYYDIEAEQYPEDLFSECGFDASCLPPVMPMGGRIGQVTTPAATATGLEAHTDVRLATYDAICAFWGSGVGAAGDVADVSGTVTSVRVLSDQPLPRTERRVFTQIVPQGGRYILGGSNNLGGGLIEWLKQSFYGGEDLAYDLIEAEAERSGVAARGLLFLPYLLGERCPLWDADARGVFFGLERQHQRADFARATCESAAFGVEHVLRAVRMHGITPQRLRVSGGLARLNLVNRIKADVTGLPVEVVEEFETTAVGAFLLAGTGAGTFATLAEGASIVRVREIILPNPERRDRYGEWFELYLKLYEALRDLFGERHRLFERHGLGGVGRLQNL